MIELIKKNKNFIIENFALIFTAIVVGIIVSIVAQLLIIAAYNIFQYLFLNNNFSLRTNILGFELNLLPFLICFPASLLVGLLLKYSRLSRWYGPADTIFAAHHRAGTLDLKGGFISTFASCISLSGGASVGIYGPLVHFGATISAFLRRLKFMPKIQHDILIGSGVAAAISAGFGAPIAGILFAHETVLRHFSLKAITSIALASITANFSAYEIGIVTPPLLLEQLPFELSEAITGLIILGPLAAILAILFMKLLLYIGSIPKKLGILSWQAPLIAGILCGIFGLFIDEVLGLGTSTLLKVMTENLDFSFLLLLLICKLILTSCCIGFGFFGGTFSPALFLGGILGAIVYNLSFVDLNINYLSVLAVSGMAAVSSSVIGAPITAMILVLELTGSYKYAIASIIPISICTFITSRVFGNSFFDKQLLSRGIAISKGREQIILNEIKIKTFVNKKFTKFSSDIKSSSAIKVFLKNKETEGYIISKENIFLGKVKLMDLVNRKDQKISHYIEQKPVILDADLSLLSTIKTLSKFVGESVPVIDSNSKKIIGIISENDVLSAYLNISEEINNIEKN